MPYRLAFFGTPDFAVPTLQRLIDNPEYEVALVITQPDRPIGRGHKLSSSPIKQLAEKFSLPVFQPESFKKDLKTCLLECTKFNPIDLGIVVAFGQILPQQILDWPRLGCINIHGSLLPRWRGAAPIQRAILAGDNKTGISIMQMEKGLDSGPVFCSAVAPINPEDDFGSLHDRLAKLGADLLIDSLTYVLHEKKVAQIQPTVGITYASKIEEPDLLIDWSKSALEINNQIRAFTPVPGAYTKLGDERLKIFRARVDNSYTQVAEPGKVIRSERNLLIIQTGSGALELEQLQLPGKKRLATKDFLNGVSVPKDMILG